MLNNPVNATDPTGHMRTDWECGYQEHECDSNTVKKSIILTESNTSVSGGEELYPPNNGDGILTKVILAIPGSAQNWIDVAISLDGIAWFFDAYSVGVVTYGGVAGAGIALPFVEGGPEIPVVTGLLGVGIAELATQPVIRTASYLALASSASTFIADTKAGNTRIEQGKIGSAVVNSVSFSIVGFFDPEAYSSWLLQSASVANDFGWISFPAP